MDWGGSADLSVTGATDDVKDPVMTAANPVAAVIGRTTTR